MIRSMTADDVDSVATIEQECFSLPWSRASIAAELANVNARFFVWEEGGAVLGYAGAWRILDEYDVGNIAVRLSARRRGIASQLVERLIVCAGEEGVSDISLEVRVGNTAARALYERYGFVTEGVREKYYVDGEDALIMWRRGRIEK